MLSFQSSNLVSKTKTIGRRMFLVNSFKAVVIFGILGRLASLQINESSKYKGLADKNRFREIQIAPPRGIIEDYFGKPIASNETIYQLHITPEDVSNIDELFFKLKNIINLTEERIFYLKRRLAKQKLWDTLVIADNLNWSEFSRVNLFLHELQGLRPIVSIARYYENNASAHIVGYVSEITPKDLKQKEYLQDLRIQEVAIGKTGIESLYDKEMLGEPGYLRYEVNAYGKKIRQVGTERGNKGTTYRTTLDQDIQVYAADLIKDVSGAVCVMDIYNGDIVSMVSSPAFNPNAFVHGIEKKDWDELINHRDKPLLNKAVSGLYPPGSTIKTLTALSALENDIVNPKFTVECTGYIDLYGERFHCWKKEGHGYVNMRKGIKHSCDVFFYEVARKLGIDRLSETAKKFGLGSKVLTGINEEKSGVVPNTKWKLSQLGKNWYLGETLHSGIGQGYFLTTPLQLCLMTAQLANGGYQLKPRLIIGEENRNSNLLDFLNFRNSNDSKSSVYDNIQRFNLEPLFRNQENINFVKEAMYAATNEPGGTSYASRIEEKEFMFGGKTGSSQIKTFTQEQREDEVKQSQMAYLDRDHAWFVAYAPVHDPKYAISVLVEHGGTGSGAAAPIAKKVIRKVIERDPIRKSFVNPIGQDV
ncbi:MAG: penicillin-binding protein 2 [Pelagibacteraceae bacterium]|jgi:penicillin-binding protein 2